MVTVHRREKAGRIAILAIAVVAGLIFYAIAFQVVSSIDYFNSDFFTYWLSGRLAVSGENPYLEENWVSGHHEYGASWIPNATFIYPLPLSLIFAPLGSLPLFEAFVFWLFLSQFMILGSMALLLSPYPAALNRRYLLPLLMGVVLFRATLLTFHNGQLGPLLLLVTAAVAYFWEKEKWWQGCIFLPVLALKPNLGVPVILLLSVYLLRLKKFPALAAGLVSGLLLIAASLLQNPRWILEFWQAGNTKLSQIFGYSPTVWGISGLLCNYDLDCTITLGAIFGLFFLIGFAWLIARKAEALSPTIVVGLAITTMLLLTPYTWPYDQLLLALPLIAITMRLAKRGYPFLSSSLVFLGIDILAFVLLAVSIALQREFVNILIPLLVLVLLLWYQWSSRSLQIDAQAA